jgi:hypothetical protein
MNPYYPTVYDAMDVGSIFALPAYLAISLFSWGMCAILFRKWRQRKNNAPKLLFYVFLSYSICITMMTIGFIEVITTGYKKEFYRFSMAVGYSGLMIANIFLILFAAHLFTIKKEIYIKYIYFSLVIAILLLLPMNYYGVSKALLENELGLEKKWDIRPYTSVLMALTSLVTYFKIYKEAMRISRLVDEKVGKSGFIFIARAQICMILFMLFLIGDMLLFGLTSLTGYTPFFYLSWLCAGLFFIFAYLGLIMPDWLKKRYIEK